MADLTPELINRFRDAVAELDAVFTDNRLADENVEAELHEWLDSDDAPLSWTHAEHVTADEWLFITTLYGQMSSDGQRTHIREYFPSLFVEAGQRDIRNFVPNMAEYSGLQYPWMSHRLYRMGDILRERGLTMTEYAEELRQLERSATPADPMPALDKIVKDHQAEGWKTLSVFVRDCVRGNCFPIDSRVEKELKRQNLPVNERCLVRVALTIERNPREIARMFYEVDWPRE